MALPYRPRVRWTDLPDETQDPRPDILSPKPGEKLSLVILSDRVLGVETHYLGDRTKPCTGDESSCLGCQIQMATRWKGYLVVRKLESPTQCIAELTTEAFRRCPGLQDKAVSLRGRRLDLSRPQGKPNGRVRAELVASRVEFSNLPPPLDLECALYRIWFTTRRSRRVEGAKDPGPVPGENEIAY